MKKVIVLFFSFLSVAVWAGNLPDHMYFQAMNDEMQRTQQELRIKGSSVPFFTVYKLTDVFRHQVSSSLGAALPEEEPNNNLSALVYMYTGNARKNSSGFVPYSESRNKKEEFSPESGNYLPQSYEGIRREIWQLTDKAYIFASSDYDKKEAYKKRKGLKDEMPDFSKAPKAAYQQEIPAFVPLPADTQEKVNKISELGKKLSYLEKFIVKRERLQKRYYLLDSEKDFAQYFVPQDYVHIQALFRGKEGRRYSLYRTYNLPEDETLQQAQMQQRAEDILEEVQAQYQAVKIEKPYIGPVLFEKKAAADFFFFLFYPSARYSKPLLRGDDRTDSDAGYFKDRVGMRVISPLFDVYDKPLLPYYQGVALSAFMPVDDEGVEAQDLQLVQEGKLIALPTLRSPIQGQKKSNGHGRINSHSIARAGLTNLVFVPKISFSQQQMEEKLLQRCKELDLEYCYIISSSFDYWKGEGWPESVQRIYTQDGRKESVTGLNLTGLSARSLRNILAAGDKQYIFGDFSRYEVYRGASAVSIVAPSVLVDEIELVPDMKVPDTPPLVPIP